MLFFDTANFYFISIAVSRKNFSTRPERISRLTFLESTYQDGWNDTSHFLGDLGIPFQYLKTCCVAWTFTKAITKGQWEIYNTTIKRPPNSYSITLNYILYVVDYKLWQIIDKSHQKSYFRKNFKQTKTLTGAQSISSTQAITLADIIIESPDSISWNMNTLKSKLMISPLLKRENKLMSNYGLQKFFKSQV